MDRPLLLALIGLESMLGPFLSKQEMIQEKSELEGLLLLEEEEEVLVLELL